MTSKQEFLSYGFKEWAIAVSALGKGETIMLLRKGGIKEDSKHFAVKYQKAWLYPTYEHQKPQLLKLKYSSQVQEVASGWHPETVSIQSCSEITHTISVTDIEIIKQLEPYQVWNSTMIRDRFKWKPQQPLTVLLLRVFNLPNPVTIPYDRSYGGCKSWIELQQPISVGGLQPAMTAESYQKQANKIIDIINSQ